MFGLFITDFLFIAVPILFLLLFVFALIRFLSALRENKKSPNSVPIKKHLIFLILTAVPVVALFIFVLCIVLIMASAVAFM